MDIQKRLLRKPLTTVLWQAVLIAMALLIGLSGTMVYASNQLRTIMDRYHTTIAVQTYYEHPNEYGFGEPSVSLTDSDVEYLESLDVVEKVDLRTLTGAYIPQLNAQLSLSPWGDLHPMNGDYMLERSINDSYNQVAVVGTVEESWTVWGDFGYTDLSVLGKEEPLTTYYQYAIVNVEEILAMNQDFDILPTEKWSSYDGRVFVQVPCYVESEDTWFQPGQRYIVTGAYDPSAHGMSTTVRHTPDGVTLPWIEVWAPWLPGGTYCLMEEDRLSLYRDAVSYYPYDETTDRLEVLESVGKPVTLVQWLDGTTEEFLAENPDWAERVTLLQMAQHTFPVLGTEALETMQYFVTGDAVMAEGRMFTREEYDSGARVCVISETLAQASGVKLGDTLSVSQYLAADSYAEGNYSIHDVPWGEEANEPAVGRAIIPDGLVTEDESFTVVGIYRLSRSWQDTAFAFTPNTIFFPQKAQITGGYGGTMVVERERNWTIVYTGLGPESGVQWQGWEERDMVRPRGSYGVYMSVKLKNGTMARFRETIEKSVLADHQFLTFDQGFEEAQGSIHAVMASARKLFWLAAGGWTLLLMAYVVLNQSREKRNLGIMRSVGAMVTQTRMYLFLSGLIPALAGVALGTALTGTVASLVQDKLIRLVLTSTSGTLMRGADDLAEMLAQSEISALGLLILAAIQAAVIGAVLWVHALLLTRKNARKLLGV